MTTDGVAQLLYLLDEAFEGRQWHSLLTNLEAVTAEDWPWVPPGGQRCIREIVKHVGSSKFMYHDYAFAAGTLAWDDPLVDGGRALAGPVVAMDWLRQGHARLHASLAALDDGELSRPRLTNWGERKETRWIIAVMIEHDLYHAGEINHIRSLRRQTDHWAYEEQPESDG